MKKWIFLVTFSMSFCFAIATGPSNGELRIVPIATGEQGTVLFKTYYTVNESGGHYMHPVELGWLVVSANGIWEEVSYVTLDFDDGAWKSPEDQKYLDEFEASFNWKAIPNKLRPLMEKYKCYYPIDVNIGKSSVSWTRWGIYKEGKKINDQTTMRSIKGQSSINKKGEPLHVEFFFKGIAVFNCSSYEDDEGDFKNKGPVFFSNLNNGYGLDYYTAVGIMILK